LKNSILHINTVTDYYTFGSTMPGRQFNSNSYKYGFNGKENDNETGTQDYGMRIYNPALGRFFSIDPLVGKYPYYSPYHFAGNNPIWASDLDGAEENLKITPTNPQLPALKTIDMEEVIKRQKNIDTHLNAIVNAVKIDDAWKEKNKDYIKDRISKIVSFDNKGNPSKINGEPIFEGQSSQFTGKVNESAKTAVHKDPAKLILQGGRVALTTVLTPVLGLPKFVFGMILSPLKMGDQMSSYQLDIAKQQGKQAAFTNAVNNKIADAIGEVVLGEKQDKPLVEIKVNKKDNTVVEK
jgi:RHS repeat-associated protein